MMGIPSADVNCLLTDHASELAHRAKMAPQFPITSIVSDEMISGYPRVRVIKKEKDA